MPGLSPDPSAMACRTLPEVKIASGTTGIAPARRPAPAKRTRARWRRQDEEGNRHQQRELLRKDCQGAEDACRHPSSTEGARRGHQRKPEREQILGMKDALHCHPDGQQQRDDYKRDRLPPGMPATTRPEPGDHAGHERQPGRAPDPQGRREGARAMGPALQGAVDMVAIRPQGAGRRERLAVPDLGHGGNARRKEGVHGRNRRLRKSAPYWGARRWIRTSDLAVGDGPGAVQRLGRIEVRRPGECGDQCHKQCRRHDPAEHAHPPRERSVEPVGDGRKPSAFAGNDRHRRVHRGIASPPVTRKP